MCKKNIMHIFIKITILSIDLNLQNISLSRLVYNKNIAFLIKFID